MADAASCRFLFLHLRATGRGWSSLATDVASTVATLPDVGIIGTFMGLFGIGNHDVFALLAGPAADGSFEARVRAALPAHVAVLDALTLHATARPVSDAALVRHGVYVFRFFDVREGDVDEIVRLSRTAWETFEKPAGGGNGDYASEPVGLFREAHSTGSANADTRGRMLLLTWYDDLTSWERSRTPAPEAAANFRRRAELTTGTIAYATRLVP